MYHFMLPLPPRQELQPQYEQRVVTLEKALFEMQRRVRRCLSRVDVSPTLKFRIKRFESLYEKLLRRSRENPDATSLPITDILGIRVVCPFMEDLAVVEDAISAAFEVSEVERKGSQLGTTEFGYSSVHLLLPLPDDIRDSFHLDQQHICEVQLRTILQDAWAEVEHELVYKAELTPLDGKLRRKLAALNANLTLSDIIFQEIRDYQRTMSVHLMRRRADLWGQLENITGEESGGEESDTDIIETGSETIDGLLLKALHCHNQRDYEEAMRIYTDILAYQPEDVVAAIIHTHRGMARFALNDPHGAIEDFSATIDMDPHATRAYHYRGVVFRSLGERSQAMKDFDRSLESDPFHLDSRLARGALRREAGDIDGAREDYLAAWNMEQENPAVQALGKELGFSGEVEDGNPVLSE